MRIWSRIVIVVCTCKILGKNLYSSGACMDTYERPGDEPDFTGCTCSGSGCHSCRTIQSPTADQMSCLSIPTTPDPWENFGCRDRANIFQPVPISLAHATRVNFRPKQVSLIQALDFDKPSSTQLLPFPSSQQSHFWHRRN